MDRTMADDSIDWDDVNFSTSDFTDAMTAESPWGTTVLNDFTNLADDSDGPGGGGGLGIKAESSTSHAHVPSDTQGALNPPTSGLHATTSTESSSQDSSSESSSQRKRKTTSESPMSDAMTERNPGVKTEDAVVGGLGNYGPTYGGQQSLPGLAVEASMAADNGDSMFEFQSTASSPNLNREFNQQMSLGPKLKFPAVSQQHDYSQESPVGADAMLPRLSRAQQQQLTQSQVQTINPGMFTLGSRDQSPATANMLLQTASPNAIFSTPSSDSNDAYNTSANWNGNMIQNPAWTGDFSNQFTSPAALGMTPSPIANGSTPAAAAAAIRGPPPSSKARSPLHIAPISTKSRVETQINVVMTLEQPPADVEQLHLPLHTIAKSKLLAKDHFAENTVLELHAMLVCTSAMHNPALKEKALQRAALQDNGEIQRRAQLPRVPGEEDRNDPKNIPEDDKPSNGGEVRICPNCIQRERKRAGRKKLKREEEQQHWERYETERVVVFNSNEYLEFKPFDPVQQPRMDDEAHKNDEPYSAPDGAITVAAAMRIACYCRHQSEKEGFQVIFTLKDYQGNVVAQQLSDSILITDDHKTHPPSLSSGASIAGGSSGGDNVFSNTSANNGSSTMQHSHSMVDLSSHQQPFQSSRSAGNLQALGYGQQYNPHSHVHQLSQPGFASQNTSATMTPTTLSRPGSPTNAGQSGPNKKRKSSTFHRRVPSGLQMTPRVDTNLQTQPSSSNLSSAVSTQMPGTFSPSMVSGFNQQQNNAGYMTLPQNNDPSQFFGSGPPTPAHEAGNFMFSQSAQLDLTRAQNASAYFSHPSSAVPSRSTSPVLQQRSTNLAAFARHPIQTPTNSLRPGSSNQAMFATPAGAASTQQQMLDNNANDAQSSSTTAPIITKITPSEGPVSGGTEVSIFGYNFTHGTQIMFGDSVAPTTFYGSQCILATSPPGRRGNVRVSPVSLSGQQQYPSPTGGSAATVFTYKDGLNPQMMELALKFLSQQQTGDPGRWVQYTNEVAAQFMNTSISPSGGMQGQGYGGGGGGGNVMAGAVRDADDLDERIAKDCVKSSPLQVSRRLAAANMIDSAFVPAGAHFATARSRDIIDNPRSSSPPKLPVSTTAESCLSGFSASGIAAWRDIIAAQIGSFQHLPTPCPPMLCSSPLQLQAGYHGEDREDKQTRDIKIASLGEEVAAVSPSVWAPLLPLLAPVVVRAVASHFAVQSSNSSSQPGTPLNSALTWTCHRQHLLTC